jgi:antitoxin (DNA-binding transcriptional repressor) of toxin-antitoxin stability system
MGYLSVTDLKKTKALGEQLAAEREIIVTRDGKPMAIMVGVDGDSVESSLREIRRALFSAAVTRIRDRAATDAPDPSAIESAIHAARRDRAR